MPELDLETLRSLARLGVHFSVPLNSPMTGLDYFATPEELVVLAENREEFEAHAHGLTIEQYREWTGSEWSVRCVAITKAGSRCQNFAKGGFNVPAKEWLTRYGEKCVNHGG
ncbi:MAG TPA: hypothetical protein VK814_04605 [Acidobacteriaceae bacterium]|jgi:hypothetical protein|nr:hypothetical protein [Acidobacteriaceae bacterium]